MPDNLTIQTLRREMENLDQTFATRRAAIAAQIAQLEARSTKYGGDIYEDGNVLSFVKQFGETNYGYRGREYHSLSRVYEYVAIKCGGRWFVTGNNAGKAYTWEGLIDFMESRNVIDPNVHICTGWEPLSKGGRK